MRETLSSTLGFLSILAATAGCNIAPRPGGYAELLPTPLAADLTGLFGPAGIAFLDIEGEGALVGAEGTVALFLPNGDAIHEEDLGGGDIEFHPTSSERVFALTGLREEIWLREDGRWTDLNAVLGVERDGHRFNLPQVLGESTFVWRSDALFMQRASEPWMPVELPGVGIDSVSEVVADAPSGEAWVSMFDHSLDDFRHLFRYDGTAWHEEPYPDYLTLANVGGRAVLQRSGETAEVQVREGGQWVTRQREAILAEVPPTEPVLPMHDHAFQTVALEPISGRVFAVQQIYGSCSGGFSGCYPPLLAHEVYVTEDDALELVATLPADAGPGLVVVDGTVWTVGTDRIARIDPDL